MTDASGVATPFPSDLDSCSKTDEKLDRNIEARLARGTRFRIPSFSSVPDLLSTRKEAEGKQTGGERGK